MSENFKVLLRVRPMITREISNNDQNCIQIDHTQISLKESTGNPLFDEFSQLYQFNFDEIFGQSSQNDDIFTSVKPLINSFLDGYNASIMCYGLTSSGKTFTMLGILPSCINYIFSNTQNPTITLSYVQIYNEQLQDLLEDQSQLKIRETPQGEIFVENLSQFLVKSLDDVMQLLEVGLQNRKTASTVFNELSSRSHTILTLYLETESQGQILRSKIQFVDLAGSEKTVNQEKQQQRETSNINKSLNALGNVIFALTESRQGHIPYRDSLLTRILQDSIGANCLASLIVNLSPASSCFYETLNSVRFAERAKKVKQRASRNVIESAQGTIQQLEKTIQELKQELQEIGASGVEGKIKCNQISSSIANIEFKLENGGNLTNQSIINDIKMQSSQSQSQISSINKFQTVLNRQTETLVHLSSRILERNNQVIGLQNEIFALEQYNRQLENKLTFLTVANQISSGVNLQNNIPEIEAGLHVQAREIAVLEKQIEIETNFYSEIEKMLQKPLQVKEIIQKEVKDENFGLEKLNKYYKEQKALIILIKNKFSNLLMKVGNGNESSKMALVQLCSGVIQAMEGSKKDYE